MGVSFLFLKILGNNINRSFCREEITSHPDYPALTSIVDFFDSGNLQYKAVQADVSYLDKFHFPLLVHIKEPGNEYIRLVNSIEDWRIDKEIAQYWSGIVIYSETGSKWQNDENLAYQNESLKTKLLSVVLVLFGLGIYLLSSFHYNLIYYNLFGLFSILGLAFSLLLLGTELGIQSKIVKQVCGVISDGGCDKVLKSSYAKGFVGITPADASVVYFASQFVIYVYSCLLQNVNTTIIGLSLFGVLISIWSVYTQAVKLKQFCTLCLSIVSILIFQFLLVGILCFYSYNHIV